jgi:hypothetical protein
MPDVEIAGAYLRLGEAGRARIKTLRAKNIMGFLIRITRCCDMYSVALSMLVGLQAIRVVVRYSLIMYLWLHCLRDD